LVQKMNPGAGLEGQLRGLQNKVGRIEGSARRSPDGLGEETVRVSLCADGGRISLIIEKPP
jgi:hypothetical protein